MEAKDRGVAGASFTPGVLVDECTKPSNAEGEPLGRIDHGDAFSVGSAPSIN